ncbi:PP0621 family protein [Sulfurospirillum barnesii]|uniref:Prokaryotic metallothionein n=1 Tax=Sulfurospirillum barnesii (strain ATCC 700032 / DSM 10660 / SES-3) TaxID=760154 RepID=I3XUW5_SULBS|nr:PP0621 family protein [Sulfurospirillum barnesii]AFL67739.1 Prokaryotic metallothionein [Sulfurospirillum barnesii SES-3]
MLFKIAILLGVLFLIYLFFFKNRRQEDVKKSTTHTKVLEGETMVECQKCSTFVSHNEAIIKDGQFYCSKECARLS